MIQLFKVDKLSEIAKYENPKTSDTTHSGKKWTEDVPIILVSDDKVITTDQWVYINNNDELVYDKKKNLWCQGKDWYDKGKSHIKEIYVITNT
ncbi:hypothetical protein [Priestia megaterium]|uniref:hypothetical protein n=1 Tax=Priestia megaterium TaxID=1404 RepID=UPI0011273485|nr:hypothetical protein [Priestia megaterium]TPF18033.1 hypothetical protein CBE78_02060 [Priestia megaterium]TPF22140.1 hypothetical protein CBE79_04565 [Priestia megaterium]